MRIRDLYERPKGRYLEKIWKLEDEIKTMSVLLNPKADNGARFGLVTTLAYYGYTVEEALNIVFTMARWEKMDKQRTIIEVRKVYTKKQRIMSNGLDTHTSTSFKSSPSTLTIDDLITLFWKDASPIPKLKISNDVRFAAWQYHEQGFHVVPKDAKGKFPSIPWKQYQDRKPTLSELDKWDWKHGLCLIATKDTCFLDIDQPYELPWKGHSERTPRGGVHVFGRGAVRNRKIQDVGEIKGYGTLIVSYPTEGYKT